MVTSSRYLMNGSPSRCTFCNEPFRSVEVWRTANGDHFCSEFCADDAAYDDYARSCADVGADDRQGAGVFVDGGGLFADR